VWYAGGKLLVLPGPMLLSVLLFFDVIKNKGNDN
jgi:hypothetical protein